MKVIESEIALLGTGPVGADSSESEGMSSCDVSSPLQSALHKLWNVLANFITLKEWREKGTLWIGFDGLPM